MKSTAHEVTWNLLNGLKIFFVLISFVWIPYEVYRNTSFKMSPNHLILNKRWEWNHVPEIFVVMYKKGKGKIPITIPDIIYSSKSELYLFQSRWLLKWQRLPAVLVCSVYDNRACMHCWLMIEHNFSFVVEDIQLTNSNNLCVLHNTKLYIRSFKESVGWYNSCST